jgi:hypothetical protein
MHEIKHCKTGTKATAAEETEAGAHARIRPNGKRTANMQEIKNRTTAAEPGYAEKRHRAPYAPEAPEAQRAAEV